MGRRTILNVAGALVLCMAAAVVTSAQDFQRSYNLGDGGTVEIANVSGDINLTGYEGSAVVVNAYREGRDANLVEVEDLSTQGRVQLRVKYPNNCNCEASMRFEVRVPRAANLNYEKISTASGDLKAEGFASSRLHLTTASGNVLVSRVGGEIRATSASGNVRVADATGQVNANSASGNVEVELTRLEGTGDMKFTSASGDVHVRMPSNIDAQVSLSTVSGDIETNFPIEVKRSRHGSGSRAEGQLGSGARTLKISSASGDVSLKSN